jgi:hypothetical protein
MWESGCRTGKGGAVLEAQDIINSVLYFSLSLITCSGLLAVAKPYCRSWARCTLVALVALMIPLFTLQQLILESDSSSLLIGVGRALALAAIAAPLAGWGLWQFAKQGPAWKWPYR